MSFGLGIPRVELVETCMLSHMLYNYAVTFIVFKYFVRMLFSTHYLRRL